MGCYSELPDWAVIVHCSWKFFLANPPMVCLFLMVPTQQQTLHYSSTPVKGLHFIYLYVCLLCVWAHMYHVHSSASMWRSELNLGSSGLLLPGVLGSELRLLGLAVTSLICCVISLANTFKLKLQSWAMTQILLFKKSYTHPYGHRT